MLCHYNVLKLERRIYEHTGHLAIHYVTSSGAYDSAVECRGIVPLGFPVEDWRLPRDGNEERR